MGYSTFFTGEIKISPSLSVEEIDYLKAFNRSRRSMLLASPYSVARTSFDFRQPEMHDAALQDSNPALGQPDLWCSWIPTDDGTALKWSGAEKSYKMAEWLEYLIQHFIGPTPLAVTELHFLVGHQLNGEVYAAGERAHDHWKIVVTKSIVTVLRGRIVYK